MAASGVRSVKRGYKRRNHVPTVAIAKRPHCESHEQGLEGCRHITHLRGKVVSLRSLLSKRVRTLYAEGMRAEMSPPTIITSSSCALGQSFAECAISRKRTKIVKKISVH